MAKVLIVAPQWLGDAVMTHSLIQLLAKQHTVDVLCADWIKPIYQRMQEVNDIIAMPLQHGKFQWKLYRCVAEQLKIKGYSQCLIVPRKLKAALIPWLAGIKKRTGYLGESRYFLINDRVKPQKQHPYWVEKVCDLYDSSQSLQSLPKPILQTDKNNQQHWQKQHEWQDKKLIALMPGASYGPSKQWPIEKFSELAQQLAQNYQVLILGGKAEQQAATQIAKQHDKIHNLTGETSLQDTVDLLALCDFCVTNDSGLMHIAAAVGCFVKALFGSSSPDYTPPLTNKKRVFSDDLECKPCFKRTCEFGHYNCWKEITVERVLHSE